MKNIIPTFPYEDSLNVVVSSKNRYNKKVGITQYYPEFWIRLASTLSAYALTKKIDIGLAFASDYFHQF